MFEQFVQSESFSRLVGLVPQLTAARDPEAVLNILTKEASGNWDLFFDNINNEDYKDNFVETVADYLVQGWEFTQAIPDNSLLGKAPMFINHLLSSSQLPSYSSRQPLESLTKIVVAVFSKAAPGRPDLSAQVGPVVAAARAAWAQQTAGLGWAGLDRRERVALLARTLEAELVSPAQTVWAVYHKARTQQDCAAHLLCAANSVEHKAGSGQTR